MINFIKQLFGFGEPQETVKEILTPPAKAEVPAAVYIPPAKPTRHRAGTVADIKLAPIPAKTTAPSKKRRPYRGNKVKAGGTVAKIGQPKPAITEGKTKGGNGAIKQPVATK